MSTLATGSVSGGVKKSSGVIVAPAAVEVWNTRVHGRDAVSDFLVLGFCPASSKTHVYPRGGQRWTKGTEELLTQ